VARHASWWRPCGCGPHLRGDLLCRHQLRVELIHHCVASGLWRQHGSDASGQERPYGLAGAAMGGSARTQLAARGTPHAAGRLHVGRTLISATQPGWHAGVVHDFRPAEQSPAARWPAPPAATRRAEAGGRSIHRQRIKCTKAHPHPSPSRSTESPSTSLPVPFDRESIQPDGPARASRRRTWRSRSAARITAASRASRASSAAPSASLTRLHTCARAWWRH
jgi:hypothetical protein